MIAALLCLPFAQLEGLSASNLGLMATFGVVEYGIAFMVFAVGARYVPAAQSTLIALLEMVLAPLWVWLIVDEHPGTRTIIGGTIMLASLSWLAIRDLRRDNGDQVMHRH